MRNRRSAISIMSNLIGLVTPLLPIMLIAVILGVAGFLCAIFLTIVTCYAFLMGNQMPILKVAVVLIVLAIMRGILHYGEQYCNHYIAFKLLAIIRHKVFAAIRRLCPAKLESRDRGDLISIITSDIELLEVFYAHTLSPIMIALSTSAIMLAFIGQYSFIGAVIAFAGYVTVGVIIPVLIGRAGGEQGMEFRQDFGELNSFVLDSLRGLDETIQYQYGGRRIEEMQNRARILTRRQKYLNKLQATQKSTTNAAIMISSVVMLFTMLYLQNIRMVDGTDAVVCTVAMLSSFGPVVALSNLANNLHQTLASGERVLSLLEEEPQIKEVTGGANLSFEGAFAKNIQFTYEKEMILENCSVDIPKGKIIGIHGSSGSGKSTLLKLLMRFWDVQEGAICVSDTDIKKVNTSNLREMESYVTQETHLFHDTIARNIEIGRLGATGEEIVGELGDTLSGGERQRIGIARALLHDAPFLLLDEPTSNLDALNEGIILKSIAESCENKTVLLVSHRKSTMNFADHIIEMDRKRVS